MHSLNTIREADVIAVPGEGVIVECGAHEDPMSMGGHCARLFTLQGSGYPTV